MDLCELENAPETQKCPKTFVHDCSFKCRWSRWAQSKQGVPIMPARPFHVALYLFELIEGTLQKKIGCSVIDPALYGIRSQGSRVGVSHTASHGCCSCQELRRCYPGQFSQKQPLMQETVVKIPHFYNTASASLGDI